MNLYKKHPAKPITDLEAKTVLAFKESAYDEYLAARVLFNSGCLQQACVFANTAIEKEIKAYLHYHGLKAKGHEIFNLFNQMLRKDPGSKTMFNRDFIEDVHKIYKYRYPEDLNAGYNFIICRNKFLAELDYTYTELELKTEIFEEPSPVSRSYYKAGLARKDKRLFENNYLLNNISKEVFLKQNDLVHELRLISSNVNRTYKAHYNISHNPDTQFKHEALKIIPASPNGEPKARMVITYPDIVIESLDRVNRTY